MYRNVIKRWKRDKHPAARPLSNRAIALGAVIVLGIGAAAFIVLLRRYGGAGTGVELDAIRTASAITVAAGGAAALLLAARRQQSTERTLEHERENAAEQRITELYTRAVDQLGAEKAPVRLGGLHALERLAQNNPTQRQTIVGVITAYLRMPFTPPGDHAPGDDAPEDAHSRYEQRHQEARVRQIAQRILTNHLNPEAATVFWPDISLNLTEAHLHQLDLTACHVQRTRFSGATFTRYALFSRATFTGEAMFGSATFTGEALFDGVTFAGDVLFDGATFAGDTVFDGARMAPSAFPAVLPIGWTTRPATEGEEEGWLYLMRDEDSTEQSADAPGDGPV